MKKTSYNPHTLIKNLSSEAYHATPDTFSSSQFKDMLYSEKLFIKKHITKEIPRENSENFDIGTYLHSSILEPHRILDDCAVYEGKVRRGSEWDKFKGKNEGKAIISVTQKEMIQKMCKSVRSSPIAQQYLIGVPEISLFIQLHILKGKIYAPYFGMELTRKGWVKNTKEIKGSGYKLTVKVRADNLGEDFISDLKSTSGDAESEEEMGRAVKRYGYQLSAALYLDMFALLKPKVSSFWLIFASKQLFNCKAYRLHDDKILVGRAQYMWAMLRLAECAKNNFESIEYPGILKVLPEEMYWLQEREEDFL